MMAKYYEHLVRVICLEERTNVSSRNTFQDSQL